MNATSRRRADADPGHADGVMVGDFPALVRCLHWQLGRRARGRVDPLAIQVICMARAGASRCG